MTLDELRGEKKALNDFKQWLEDKLLAVDIDLAGNEQEQEDILNDMYVVSDSVNEDLKEDDTIHE